MKKYLIIFRKESEGHYMVGINSSKVNEDKPTLVMVENEKFSSKGDGWKRISKQVEKIDFNNDIVDFNTERVGSLQDLMDRYTQIL